MQVGLTNSSSVLSTQLKYNDTGDHEWKNGEPYTRQILTKRKLKERLRLKKKKTLTTLSCSEAIHGHNCLCIVYWNSKNILDRRKSPLSAFSINLCSTLNSVWWLWIFHDIGASDLLYFNSECLVCIFKHPAWKREFGNSYMHL